MRYLIVANGCSTVHRRSLIASGVTRSRFSIDHDGMRSHQSCHRTKRLHLQSGAHPADEGQLRDSGDPESPGMAGERIRSTSLRRGESLAGEGRCQGRRALAFLATLDAGQSPSQWRRQRSSGSLLCFVSQLQKSGNLLDGNLPVPVAYSAAAPMESSSVMLSGAN